MIMFKSLWATFKVSNIFLDGFVIYWNWLEPKTKPPWPIYKLVQMPDTHGTIPLAKSSKKTCLHLLWMERRRFSFSQIHQHFTSSFCADFLLPKNYKTQTVRKHIKQCNTLLYKKAALKMLVKLTSSLLLIYENSRFKTNCSGLSLSLSTDHENKMKSHSTFSNFQPIDK